MDFNDQEPLYGLIEFPNGEIKLCTPKTESSYANLQEMHSAQIRHGIAMHEFINYGASSADFEDEYSHRTKMQIIATIHTLASAVSLFASFHICSNSEETGECFHSIQLGSVSVILTFLLCFLSNNI